MKKICEVETSMVAIIKESVCIPVNTERLSVFSWNE